MNKGSKPDEKLEKIKKQKIEKRLNRLEEKTKKKDEKIEELQREVERLKSGGNTVRISENDSQNQGISRRQFLKKAGIGTAGIAALMSPVSALNIRSNALSFNNGERDYLDINTESNEFNIKNSDLNVGSPEKSGGVLNVGGQLDMNNNDVIDVNSINGRTPGGAIELIEHKEIDSSIDEFHIEDISDKFRHLKILSEFQTTSSGKTVYFIFNKDKNENSRLRYIRLSEGEVSGDDRSSEGIMDHTYTAGPGERYDHLKLTIFDYTASNKQTNLSYTISGEDRERHMSGSGWWLESDSINSIGWWGDGDTFDSGSYITLYGMR